MEGLPMDFPMDFPAVVAVGRGGQRKALLKKPAVSGRRRRSIEADVDPNRPKKPAGGGYGIYLKEHRAQILQELGPNSKGATDISKVAAGQWKAMTPDERKPYEDRYRQKYEDYLKAMNNHIGTGTALPAALPGGGDVPETLLNDRLNATPQDLPVQDPPIVAQDL